VISLKRRNEHLEQKGGLGRLFCRSRSALQFRGRDPGRKAVAGAPMCEQQIGQMRA